MKQKIKSLLLLTTSVTVVACNSGGMAATGSGGLQQVSQSVAIKVASDKLWSFDSGTVSLVYPQRSLANNNVVNFIMRGDSLDTIESFGSQSYLPVLIKAIKQADPIDFYQDFNGQTSRNIKVIDVKLNGFHGNNEATLFTNYASGDTAKDYFKKTKPVPLSAENKTTTSTYTDSDGKSYNITSQMYFVYNPQSEDNNARAKALVDKIYQEASSSSEPVIFYIHCDSGHDRTGLISTMYLLDNYMKINNSANYADTDMQRLIELGQVVWKGDKYNISNYNDGRKYQQSAYYGSNGDEFINILANSFGTDSGILNWAKIVPATIKTATPPAIDEYAWTSPLCNSGYGGACLTLGNNILSINNTSMISQEQLGNYSYYLVYVNANGLPIKDNAGENYLKYSPVKGATYPLNINLNNKPAGAAALKLYVYPINDSMKGSNQSKLDYVASITL